MITHITKVAVREGERPCEPLALGGKSSALFTRL